MPDVFDKAAAWPDLRVARELDVYPYYRRIDASTGTEVVVDGKRLVMAGSNDYLGLANDPRVIAAARHATQKYGTTSSGSRLLNGTRDLHEQLEQRLATFLGKEAVLVASTGFQTNLALLSSLVGRHDTALCDREIHASLVDGLRLSFGKLKKFDHNDMQDLATAIEAAKGAKLIVTEGVFSMYGDLCDLRSVVSLARQHGARVLLDDAHGIGVMGARGRGTAEHFDSESGVDLITGTFSKSLASLGGFIAGPRVVIDFVRHKARAVVFSAAMTPASVAAALASLEIIEGEPARRETLWRHTRRVHRELASLGFSLGATQTPIVSILIGDSLRCYRLGRALFDAGIFVNPIIPPAVAPARALVRMSLMATHTDAQIDRILDVLAKHRAT